jgi:hypothetical protein
MKKFVALAVLIAALSVPAFADTVFQLDAGAGVGAFFLYGFPLPAVSTNIQAAWYSSNSRVGGGFHVNADFFPLSLIIGEGGNVLTLSIGGDFVWASRSNKGLWNIGAGASVWLDVPTPFFIHVTTGYQWAFGNRNHRFALKPSISVVMIPDFKDIEVYPFASLSLNYSFNNAQTHGR